MRDGSGAQEAAEETAATTGSMRIKAPPVAT
jgi:hypothetical protein